MKIKCVDDYGCGYLTVGKVYRVKAVAKRECMEDLGQYMVGMR